MDINEITIFSNTMPEFSQIVRLVSKILNLKEDSLVYDLETIDDWYFTNEQKINIFNKEVLNEKTVLVDLNLKLSKERVANMQFEKNNVYRLDIHFEKDVKNRISKKIFDELVEILNYNFEFITFGDEYLLEYSKDVNYLIHDNTSIKYWIIPKTDKKYDILTIENF